MNEIDLYFPFLEYRTNQKEILYSAKESFEKGIEVVIIEGATGFGKSPVNIALGKYFKPSFYTTPQVALVKQVARDFGCKDLAIDGGYSDVMALLGRNNYICRQSKVRSDICPLYKKKKGCRNFEGCTYWVQKEATKESDVAVLTFAMLITNSFLPEEYGFSPRKLLIVDECHNLENQVASMFAGFIVSPYIFPDKVRDIIWKDLKKKFPRNEGLQEQVRFAKEVSDTCKDIISYKDTNKYVDVSKDVKERLELTIGKIQYMLEELKEGRIWVVEKGFVFYDDKKERRFHFKPVKVDRFLQKKVWSQACRIVLSSATIPFRANIDKWLERLGLGNKNYIFLSAPMTFPIENRRVILDYMGGKMTSILENQNWRENIEKVKEILKKHTGERGVIHTQSYERAKRVYEDLKGFSLYLHDQKGLSDDESINKDIIQKWIKSGLQTLLSPSVKEGVDLKDDLCRFQILLKVPYPNVADPRVKYLLDQKEWIWYFNEAIRDVVQCYGRAVRSEEDYASFYIIDGSFDDLIKKKGFPQWFLDAIKRDIKVNKNSLIEGFYGANY